MESLQNLITEGYDHIVDIHDNDNISHIAYVRGHSELGKLLDNIPEFEVNAYHEFSI